MRYQFDQIAAFIQVVDAGSVSAAADRLNLAKSVVSKRVADLEKTLGVELVRRSSRGIVPTEQGHFFYSNARVLLREFDNAVEEMSAEGELGGAMRITVPVSCSSGFRLNQLLFSFASLHPRLELHLHFDDHLMDIEREGYDLAIRITRPQASSLIARKLAVFPRVLCCSAHYAEAFGVPAALDDLSRHSCIAYGRPGPLWEFEVNGNGLSRRAIPVTGRVVTNNIDAARDAAIAGLGISVLPLFMVEELLRSGQLKRVLPDVRPVPDTACALYPRSRRPSRKIAALVEFLSEAFRRKPWDARALSDVVTQPTTMSLRSK